MDQNIDINNPQEVRKKIIAETLLLRQYAEDLSQEAKSLYILENLVSDASQVVAERKRGINVAIEQVRRYEDSPGKQEALRSYQKRLEDIENQARTINQCRDNLLGIRRDLMSVVKDSTALSDTGSVLASKLQQLLDRIIEAV